MAQTTYQNMTKLFPKFVLSIFLLFLITSCEKKKWSEEEKASYSKRLEVSLTNLIDKSAFGKMVITDIEKKTIATCAVSKIEMKFSPQESDENPQESGKLLEECLYGKKGGWTKRSKDFFVESYLKSAEETNSPKWEKETLDCIIENLEKEASPKEIDEPILKKAVEDCTKKHQK